MWVSNLVNGRKLEYPLDDLEFAILVQIEKIPEYGVNSLAEKTLLCNVVLALRELEDLRKTQRQSVGLSFMVPNNI